MSDIKPFLLRMPPDLYASLELQAVEMNTSMNRLIVEKLRDVRNVVPAYQQAAEQTRKIAAKLPNTFAGCDIPTPQRAGHDPKTCRVYRCGLCAASKGDR